MENYNQSLYLLSHILFHGDLPITPLCPPIYAIQDFPKLDLGGAHGRMKGG